MAQVGILYEKGDCEMRKKLVISNEPLKRTRRKIPLEEDAEKRVATLSEDKTKEKLPGRKRISLDDFTISTFRTPSGVHIRLQPENGGVGFVFSTTDILLRLIEDYSAEIGTAVRALRREVSAMKGGERDGQK
jgi:hypothetical protein